MRTVSTEVLRLLLPLDDLELAGSDRVRCAGDVEVFAGAASVEGHPAPALRASSGQLNLASILVVGDGRRDAYAFYLEGDALGWRARLFWDSSGELPFKEVARGEWLETEGYPQKIVMLMQPPAGRAAGELEVRLQQRTTWRVETVVFTLDAGAGA
jgi:hypothetical protein